MKKHMTKRAKMKLHKTNMKRTTAKMRPKFAKIRPQKTKMRPILAFGSPGQGPFFSCPKSLHFGREKKGPWPGDPKAKMRPKKAKIRPKRAMMRPKMAKMRA